MKTTYCSHGRRVTWDDQEAVWFHEDDSTTCGVQPAWREAGDGE